MICVICGRRCRKLPHTQTDFTEAELMIEQRVSVGYNSPGSLFTQPVLPETMYQHGGSDIAVTEYTGYKTFHVSSPVPGYF